MQTIYNKQERRIMMSSVIVSMPIKRYSLRDGSEVLIRPLLYDDKDAILSLFHRLSRETRFLRYHFVKTKMPEAELEQYCTPDCCDAYVLVAERCQSDGNGIIGLARYDRLPCYDAAEVSFLVDDAEQGKGICTLLIRDLAERARENSITTFVAEMLNENNIMFDIIRKFSPDLVQVIDGTSNCTTFPI
jgi:L-amino acid N-acyltransferase YncA